MHFLNPRGGLHILEQALGKRRACVTVKVLKGGQLEVQAGQIGVLKADALITRLPDKFLVVGPDGKTIRATGAFYVTTETFDPFHAVLDLF